MRKRVILFIVLALFLFSQSVQAQRLMEYFDRGVIAVRSPQGVFVNWRLLGTDPDAIAFNLYRSAGSGKGQKLNRQPITKTTSYTDTTADSLQSYTYSIKAILKGKEEKEGKSFTLKKAAAPYVSIPLQTPAGYAPSDGSVGDLE